MCTHIHFSEFSFSSERRLLTFGLRVIEGPSGNKEGPSDKQPKKEISAKDTKNFARARRGNSKVREKIRKEEEDDKKKAEQDMDKKLQDLDPQKNVEAKEQARDGLLNALLENIAKASGLDGKLTVGKATEQLRNPDVGEAYDLQYQDKKVKTIYSNVDAIRGRVDPNGPKVFDQESLASQVEALKEMIENPDKRPQ
jgi:hypothetical protein